MKRILLSLFVGVGLLTSCDMDKAPYGSLDDSSALQSVNDYAGFRNGIYSNIRSFATGGYLYYSDIQSDQFLGLTIAGNRNGEFNNGLVTASSQAISSVFEAMYTRISNTNYFLNKAEAAIAIPDYFTGDEMVLMQRYIAEAKFARAYYYFWMMERFCQQYTPDKADTPALGLQLVTEFNPNGNSANYPGRSTMAETIKLIKDDLAAAHTGLAQYEQTDNKGIKPMAPYINTYVVDALEARIALYLGDYATAISKAESVINSQVYTLANVDNYIDMWTNDESTELIFVPFVDASESGGIDNTSYGYISYQDEKSADYIPTIDVLASYDDNDVRFNSFFNVWNLNFDGDSQPAYVFFKYPGNSALINGVDYRKNKPKPFRLSEQYLILAEAAAASGATDKANSALNTLRRNRIEGWEDVSYTGSALTQQIRNERAKELIGEGFRLNDLRRWGVAFQRNGEYPINDNIEQFIVSSSLSCKYTADDTRYTWPIPTAEMEINPQLAGQQNPGY